ncbi:MAG: hypothetical protein Tsb002_04030 [Wenzhouxiangellaceae bacterium]
MTEARQPGYLSPPNLLWPREYQLAAQAIDDAYDGAIELHHIGSTSVPGLYAKDCIDILGIVPDLAKVSSQVNHLLALGYEHRGAYGITGREYFSRPRRKTHLHIYARGNPQIERHLSFVEAMRSSPAQVAALNRLKQQLYEQFPNDQKAYQQGKQHFYEQLLTTATLQNSTFTL